MDVSVTDFSVAVSDEAIGDLRERLLRTRWADPETVDDWSQGVPLAYQRELCEYWANQYDMRRVEARLNQFPQLRVELDGLGIHCIHARSDHEDATPVIMTHGWPGSVVEFLHVIEPLRNPTAHGGEAADAFHVVCPSLPGYGFSDKPTETGVGLDRIARTWDALMGALGYDSYVAQGGDWGALVTNTLGALRPDGLRGIHLNNVLAAPDAIAEFDDLTEFERETIALFGTFADEGGYAAIQSTRPQTVGYALQDSPVGQCAWIVEKFRSFTDNDGHPESAVSRDELLDNVMMYWLPGTGASAGRLYWESWDMVLGQFDEVPVPSACSVFPAEVFRFSERWTRTRYTDLRYYGTVDRGGHFAAFEEPDLFVQEVRNGFRALLGNDARGDAPK